ncbi:uncharacterized protein LOC141652622 [Silene latifolia]|uniref:uncharacterized protein LOC141652622 n=1 Tax=Silene latifolia TaxID=37657 RepID=UPI003D76DC83
MQQENWNSGASSSLSSTSPSFTTYSSENIADIAARVVHELNLSHEDPYDDEFYSSIHQNDAVEPDNDDIKANDDVDNDVEDDVSDDEESEFEFAVLGGEDTSSPISADEIFSNGQIKTSYPLFNTDLIYGAKTASDEGKTVSLRLPLRKLMMSEPIERGNDSVSSSSSDGELEGVPPETYCVWAPKKNNDEEQLTMKKKSNSTGTGVGSSKRWRFKDLLHRSNSDGKGSFVFLSDGREMKGRDNVAAVNSFNAGKKTGEMKKKSYLPYRQDLVGLFSNVNGISRTIRPF